MDIPFAGNMPLYNSTALLLQTAHSKNIVNGYSAFEDPRWLMKIKDSSARCFNLIYASDPTCNEISMNSLKKDKIEYVVFEKTVYSKGLDSKQDLVFDTIIQRFYDTTRIIYSDQNYDIGIVI